MYLSKRERPKNLFLARELEKILKKWDRNSTFRSRQADKNWENFLKNYKESISC